MITPPRPALAARASRAGSASVAALAALAAPLALAACQDDISTPFPPGLEPYDDGARPGDLAAARDEKLVTSGSDKDMIRVYGRGFVLAPPETLWRLSKLPEAMIARCNTTRQTVSPGSEPEHELSFVVHYYVDDILDVEWDDLWRGDVVTGVSAAPQLAMIKHQKVQGSDFIYLSEGSIQLLATDDPDVTELWFVEHLDAISGSVSQVTNGMRDNYDALVALAHDRAIPACP